MVHSMAGPWQDVRMKLAEALIERADLQRRIEQLRSRIASAARHQEGDDPVEDAAVLLGEATTAVHELETLVRAINLTNAATRLDDGRTMTEALAHRDALRSEHSLVSGAADAASGRDDGYRQLRSELRYVSSLPVADLRGRADELAKSLRELDSLVQRTNWEADLTS
jgi:hypothetical protein